MLLVCKSAGTMGIAGVLTNVRSAAEAARGRLQHLWSRQVKQSSHLQSAQRLQTASAHVCGDGTRVDALQRAVLLVPDAWLCKEAANSLSTCLHFSSLITRCRQ